MAIPPMAATTTPPAPTRAVGMAPALEVAEAAAEVAALATEEAVAAAPATELLVVADEAAAAELVEALLALLMAALLIALLIRLVVEVETTAELTALAVPADEATVVVTAPVVATPAVAAVELRHALEEPAWITRGEEYPMAPVLSVSLRVTLVPEARLTFQV